MAQENKRNNPEYRAAIKRLHGEGKSRAFIAKELGMAPATVGVIAGDLGLEWDRSKTASAVYAKQVDNKSRRQATIDRLYSLAEAQMDRLEGESYTHRVTTGRDSVVVVDAVPNADEVRNHMQSIYSALAIAQKLEAVDTSPNADAAVSTLRSIGNALGLSS